MKICSIVLAAMFFAAFTVQPVLARKIIDYPNSGYCKSGKHVKDVSKCKENRKKG